MDSCVFSPPGQESAIERFLVAVLGGGLGLAYLSYATWATIMQLKAAVTIIVGLVGIRWSKCRTWALELLAKDSRAPGWGEVLARSLFLWAGPLLLVWPVAQSCGGFAGLLRPHPEVSVFVMVVFRWYVLAALAEVASVLLFVPLMISGYAVLRRARVAAVLNKDV